MPINDQIPLSAGPAGAATINSSIPGNIDSRIPMSANPFKPIDVQKAYDDVGTFEAAQAKRFEDQRIIDEKKRDSQILQDYQQNGGDLYTADGLTLAAKDLSGKISQTSYQNLTKQMADTRKNELSDKKLLNQLTDQDLDAVARHTENTSKMMNQALMAYDQTLAATKDPQKATEAYNSTKAAQIQAVQGLVSPTTGKPLYTDQDSAQYADMDPERLRNFIKSTKWNQDEVKAEQARRLSESLIDKRDADAERDKQKNELLAQKIVASQGKPLEQSDAETMAEMVRVNGVIALSRFGLTPAQRQQVISTVTNLNNKDDIDAREGATAVLNIKADQKSVENMTKQLDNVTAFEKTAETIGGKLVDIAKKVDTTGVPVIERWVRAGRKAVAGDPDVTEFNARMQTFRTEMARIITQPNLTGVLSDTARREIEDILPSYSTAEQIERGVNVLINEGQTRRDNLTEQLTTAKARIMKGGRKSNVVAPADFPTVSKDEQSARDKDRLAILQHELQQKQADYDTGDEETKASVKPDIDSLKREIARTNGQSVVTSSIKKPTVSNW